MKDHISKFLRKVQAITVDNEFRRFEQVLDSQGLAVAFTAKCFHALFEIDNASLRGMHFLFAEVVFDLFQFKNEMEQNAYRLHGVS